MCDVFSMFPNVLQHNWSIILKLDMLQCRSIKPSVCNIMTFMFNYTCHEPRVVIPSCPTHSTLCCASFARPLLFDIMSSTKR